MTSTGISCPAPAAPEHGEVSFQNTSFQSVASYECGYGYMMRGELTRDKSLSLLRLYFQDLPPECAVATDSGRGTLRSAKVTADLLY